MHSYIKVLLILSFLLHLLHAEELFIAKKNLKLASITLSEKYCKNITKDKALCKSKKLSYIDFKDKNLPSFMHALKTHISPTLQVYKSENLKQSTLADLKDFGDNISGDWYTEEYIDLFSKTPATYTLSSMSTGYSGGAHGYHAVEFNNYSIKTQQKVKLSDLFISDSNQTLHTIAQKHYRQLHNLKENQSLLDDGWFDDKFVLAQNFAITPRGLLFHYNSYEIKPYAAGHTKFILPYSKIKSIIHPKGILNFTRKDTHHFYASFYRKEVATIIIDASLNANHTITLTASIQNHSYLNKGWFSLSFPELSTKVNIIKMETEGFKRLHAYPKGSKVYHNKLKKSILSSYLLVEAEEDTWSDKPHTIKLTLNVPPKSTELIVDIRSNFKSKDKSMTLPDEYNGITGQQGYQNHRVFISL